MPEDLKGYRVFIASPSGLEKERRAFRDALVDYNEMDAVSRGGLFLPVGWEATLGGVGRPQSLINEDIEKCDYFVLLLWDRWGTPPDPPGKGTYTSATEEEYKLALKRFDDPNSPMRQIIVFFKGVELRQLNDPGKQLQRVLDFKKELECTKKLLFQTFDEVDEFEKFLRRHLAQWVRDHEGGQSAKVTSPQPLPDSGAAKGLAPDGREVLPDEVGEAPSENVKTAQRLADQGQLAEAETRFAAAIVKGEDPAALVAYGRFLGRVGRLAQAKVMFERLCELGAKGHDRKWLATGYRCLGNVLKTQGDLSAAEARYSEALKIDEELGHLKGRASDYGSLGFICKARGDLDKAEEFLRKSLKIDEQLGRLEGMANDYGNLGIIYRRRGDLEEAEGFHLKSLKINEQLGRLEGMAKAYGNLGIIYRRRGDLEEAEAFHRKSLKINEQLGRLEGMANQYANIGRVYKARGEVSRAREYWSKARELYDRIGMPHKIEEAQEWLEELDARG